MHSYICNDVQNDVCVEWITQYQEVSDLVVEDLILPQDFVPFFLLGSLFLFFFVFHVIYEKVKI